jgi:hypothetical protein
MAGRFLQLALVAASFVCAVVFGVIGYHAIAASRAQDPPAPAGVRAAFEDAARGWRSHIDLPVHRLVLASAEDYGNGTYLFVFDVYTWFGVGSGYATSGAETGTCDGGGLIRDGGFAGFGGIASDDGLRETRATCTRGHGPGRVIVQP